MRYEYAVTGHNGVEKKYVSSCPAQLSGGVLILTERGGSVAECLELGGSVLTVGLDKARSYKYRKVE